MSRGLFLFTTCLIFLSFGNLFFGLCVMADNHSLSGNESDIAESAVSVEIEPVTEVVKTSSSSKRTRARASKKDLDALSAKVDKICEYFERFKDTAVSDRPRPQEPSEGETALGQRPTNGNSEDTALGQRPNISTARHSQAVNLLDTDDVLSIQPGQREVASLLGSDEDVKSHRSEDCDVDSDRFMKYSGTNNKLLLDLFGEDAVTRPAKCTVGISLDDAQIAVIKESWRSEDPNRLTAYKESYKTSFPVSEKEEDLLKVPSLDEIIEQLLLKRYGAKAGISATLHSQPFKSIEKLAYQGQTSARMGLVINIYIQQALGNLLSLLQEKDTNIDQCIQCVRDIFAMSTKMLDQNARSGSFHHLVRRRMAMADTGLHDFKDLKTAVWNLPLSHTGVFGEGFEKKLKDRQELNKQIGDLLPEMNRKRKNYSSDSKQQSWKRPRYNEEKSYNNSGYNNSYNQRKSAFGRNPSYNAPKRSAPAATVTSKSNPGKGGLTSEYAGELDLLYIQQTSSKKVWNAYTFTDPVSEQTSDATPNQIKKKLMKYLRLYFNKDCCVTTVLHHGLLWGRVYLPKDAVKGYQPSRCLYFVHYPQTPVIIINGMRSAYKTFVQQCFVGAFGYSDLTDMSLTGHNQEALAELAINKQSEGGFVRFKRERRLSGPLEDNSTRKRKAADEIIDDRIVDENRGEKRQRLEDLEETFGENVQPALESVEYRVKLPFRGKEAGQELRESSEVFIGKVVFKGTNVLEGLRNLAEKGHASMPLPKHLTCVPTRARNYFILSKTKKSTEN